MFSDGSSTFWADQAQVTILKHYEKPQTIGGLARFRDRAKRLENDGHHAPVPGCQSCRNLGHMCQTCEHDEL